MHVTFRAARPEDYGYCAALYFAWVEPLIHDLNLSMAAQRANFRDRFDVAQVEIIEVDGAAAGWLQSTAEGDAFHLQQLFVEEALRRRGIGTAVMKAVIKQAANRPMTLGVVMSNPARHLYERLGFRITHQDERKFYMRREPDSGPEPAN